MPGGDRGADGAVAVVVPRRPSRVGAVDSQLMAAAHLARGFAEVVGPDDVLLITEGGPADAAAVLAASVGSPGAGTGGRLRRLPPPVRVGLGDAQAVARRRRLRGLAVHRPLRLVVQYHHRFQDVGSRLADSSGCPLVLRVEALEVAEQRAWGLRGTRGGRLVAAVGEHRLLRRADRVSVVSAPLARAVQSVGVPPGRVDVVPNGVDLELFAPGSGRPAAPVVDGLAGRFLVGWVGGFRAYHGLHQVDALATRLERRLPDATLCLLGTGPLHREMLDVARAHPASLRLLPPAPQAEVPGWLRRFDVCLQLADPGAGDHYSPLKVLEYLATGRPVVAPDVPTSSLLADGADALLYDAGDVDGAVDRLVALHDDPRLRAALAAQARTTAERRGSWAAVAERLLATARAREEVR